MTASSLKLYTPSSPAVLGKPYTLVCTWSDFGNDDDNHDVMDIAWIRQDGPQFVFNSQTCNLKNTDNGSVDITAVSAESGYLYQSLTFTNMTSSDTRVTWYCAIDQQSIMSNPVTIYSRFTEAIMSSQSDVVYTGSNISLTCTYNNLSLSTWSLNETAYFRLGQTCVIDLLAEDEWDVVRRSQTHCVEDSSQTLNLFNVTLTDHLVTWKCNVGFNTSNDIRIIVLDPQDLPQNVTLRQLDTEDENGIVVICSTACENEFHFSWDYDIPGHLSDMVYDSCKHVCSQTLTIYVGDSDHGKLVRCAVTNPRTGKISDAQYQIVTRDEVNSGIPSYIWGSAAGGGVIVIIIAAVIVVVCRRRPASKPSEVPDAEIQPKTRPVMEDNVLSERREQTSSEQDIRESKMVMEDNVLYDWGGHGQTEQDTRESKTALTEIEDDQE